MKNVVLTLVAPSTVLCMAPYATASGQDSSPSTDNPSAFTSTVDRIAEALATVTSVLVTDADSPEEAGDPCSNETAELPTPNAYPEIDPMG